MLLDNELQLQFYILFRFKIREMSLSKGVEWGLVVESGRLVDEQWWLVDKTICCEDKQICSCVVCYPKGCQVEMK